MIAAAIFWTRADGFSVSGVFTSLSIVALVATPIASLMGTVPTFMSSLACFERTQKFLLRDEQEDGRLTLDSRQGEGKTSTGSAATATSPASSEAEKQEDVTVSSSAAMVVLERASATLRGKDDPILRDITATLTKSSNMIVVGPVGSGKSTLLKAVLGEIPISSGVICVQEGRSISYCDQTPWLRNVSVRENIVAHGAFDGAWYSSVLHACALNQDISQFPDGDSTLVGSGGITLSGGQKQRVVSNCPEPERLIPV